MAAWMLSSTAASSAAVTLISKSTTTSVERGTATRVRDTRSTLRSATLPIASRKTALAEAADAS